MTLNHLRLRYIWTVNANVIVQHLLYKWGTCHKLHAKMGDQMKEDLTKE